MHGPGYAPERHGPPPGAAIVLVRVLFLALSVASCGIFAWAPMLRVALLRRRPVDWILCVASFVLAVFLLVAIGAWGSDTEADANGETEPSNAVDIGVITGLLALGFGAAVHYLIVDIRHYDGRRGSAYPAPPTGGPGGYGPPSVMPSGAPGYGYPPVQPTPGAGPVHAPAPGYGYPPAYPQPQHLQHPAQHLQTTQTHLPTQISQPSPPPAPQPPQPAQQPQSAQHPQPAQQPQSGAPSPDKPRIDQVRAELDELSDYLRKEQGR
ncbi:hypothetical protein [Streptomyces sp. NPDC047315]|uniref:hypothetical protein n=1 Tax=Streptomyces sp. NPDC047315 TaxID=3155142 RepID=UPI003408AFD5